MSEIVAKLLDVELETAVVAISNSYLEEVGNVVVNFPDVFLVGEGCPYLFQKSRPVVVVVEEERVRLIAIASGATSFLEIGFYACRTFVVYNKAHVGFVDSHAKGVCCHHGAYFSLFPRFLTLVFLRSVESSVIICGAYTLGADLFCYFAGVLSCLHINDGTAFDVVEQIHHVLEPVDRFSHDVGKVRAEETHAEHIFLPET